MKNRKSPRKYLGALVLVGIVVLIAACAPEVAPTPTPEATTPPEDIVIGQLMDYSAFFKTQGACFRAAADTFERYINEEKGGIDGRKVRFVHYDFKAQPAVAVTAVKQGNMEHNPIAWVCGYSSGINAAKQQLATDKVLMLGLPNADGLSDPESFVLITRPLYEESSLSYLKRMASEFEGPGKYRWGMLALEVMPSAQATAANVDKICEFTNTEFALLAWIPVSIADATPFMDKIEAALPMNSVALGTVDAPVAMLLKAMEERGLKDKVTPTITHHAGPNGIRSIAGSAIEGLEVTCPYASYTEADNIPMMATVCRLCKEYTPDFYPPDLLYLQAWVNYIAITDGLSLAAEKVGWDQVTSADLRDLLISGVEIDTGGLSQPLYWEGPTYHRGLHWDKTTRQTATGEEVISDWIEVPDWYKTVGE
ncbi:MAG: ABC transporter substrate-binding protein [Dehalococcoidia bacterium]|nr:MAG: ABC transporter substrate-binding protein [Dehalococcoidia bacterium]